MVALPVAAGEERRVRDPGGEVRERRRLGRPWRWRLRGRGAAHEGPRAASGVEVPLRRQLRVRLDHHRPRDPELSRERPRRGQRHARDQPPVPHRPPQLVLERRAHPAAGGRVQRDEEVHRTHEIGLLRCHPIGS